MTIQRMDHAGIVVDDLAAATAFFVELGLKLQGEGPVDRGGAATGTRRRTPRASAISHSQSTTSTPS
jgi:catechol 2,3-dioxygenase-like lactoylglutathione lyase family enzyme